MQIPLFYLVGQYWTVSPRIKDLCGCIHQQNLCLETCHRQRRRGSGEFHVWARETCLSSKTTPTSTLVVVTKTISSRDLNVYSIVVCYLDWLTTLSCPLLIGRAMNTLTLYFFCQICIHIRDKQNNNVLIQHFTSRYRLVGNLRRLVVTTIVRRHEGDQNS